MGRVYAMFMAATGRYDVRGTTAAIVKREERENCVRSPCSLPGRPSTGCPLSRNEFLPWWTATVQPWPSQYTSGFSAQPRSSEQTQQPPTISFMVPPPRRSELPMIV
ncbi:hypothetical protein HPB49_023822 [Dermacentor silvarum]|uniref:Uncharacterized protein n=1 Tax=Dermacentor silvarum TaxID=543639 RepID=A0ACB8DH24_DERSI|nr:hypothetical protein HPB49_023822 [Dermacentor silvarum]